MYVVPAWRVAAPLRAGRVEQLTLGWSPLPPPDRWVWVARRMAPSEFAKRTSRSCIMWWLTRLRKPLPGMSQEHVKSAKRRSELRRPRLTLELLEDRLAPVTNMWMGGNADWAATPVTNFWSLGHTPLSSEDVQIANGATVTHSAVSDTVHSLSISGGSTLVLSGGSITDSTT